ncbi:hypothetical protein [Sphingomonas sp.]|jgi:hypothetical protein|uniref:hypothetical protein n=1 Tax=Sphingomonas sp. TaxID=28214 RepID=UPI002E2F9039|nr:hypothetical protein [Sphingomonas sp.]HEX4693367.1 hypothetical protein [Sphingomonas sp.]
MMLYRDLEKPENPVVLRSRGKGYTRLRADEYNDAPARLTDRQSLFYRNLMQIAQQLNSNYIPVDFSTPSQGQLFLDRGCVKIAVHAGFLKPLKHDEDGVVSEVELNWDATGVWGAE